MSPTIRRPSLYHALALVTLLACQSTGGAGGPGFASGVTIAFANETDSVVRVYLVVDGDRFLLGLVDPGRATMLRAASSWASMGDDVNLAVLAVGVPSHGGPRAAEAVALSTEMPLETLIAHRWVLQGARLVAIPR